MQLKFNTNKDRHGVRYVYKRIRGFSTEKIKDRCSKKNVSSQVKAAMINYAKDSNNQLKKVSAVNWSNFKEQIAPKVESQIKFVRLCVFLLFCL